jgi:hypothetical protein
MRVDPIQLAEAAQPKATSTESVLALLGQLAGDRDRRELARREATAAKQSAPRSKGGPPREGVAGMVRPA